MPQNIWNEGRVVGLSAYEIYVKQHLSESGEPPATEREWLSASLASGNSMVLQLPSGTTGTGTWIMDIPFPEGCNLTASNVIIASFFDGDGVFVDAATGPFKNVWASKITDYGKLILNNSSYPQTCTTSDISSKELPNGSDFTPSSTVLQQLIDYSHIIDGVVMQPGTWSDTSSTPAKDLSPDLTQVPVLRLSIKGAYTTRPKILLTGFTARYILSGTAGLEGSTDTRNPEDGDFLGPQVFPWGAKVVFTMPTVYQNYLGAKISYSDLSYTAQGSGDAKAKLITVTADNTTAKLLSLSSDGTSQYTMDANPTGELYLNSAGKLTWAILAQALANNKKIDVTKNSGGTSIFVTKVTGGTGISVSPSSGKGDVTISNSGVTSATPSTGIEINGATSGAQTGGVTVKNTGVISVHPKTGISIKKQGTSTDGTVGDLDIANTGVTSVSAGTGINVSGSTGAVTISNSGVTSLSAGSGISVSHSGTTWTIKNTMSEYTPTTAWTTLTYGTDFTFASNTATTNYTGWLNGFALWDVTLNDQNTQLGPDQYPKIQVNHPSGANYTDMRIVFAQGDGDRYRLGNKNLMPSPRNTFTGDAHCFRFSHHSEWDSAISNWGYSIIAAIGFTTAGRKILMGDDYTKWAQAHIIEDPSHHMWEVSYYNGGYSSPLYDIPSKWGVATQLFKCNITRVSADNHGISAGQHTDDDKIVVTAHDIFDGFNSQYGREDAQSSTDNWVSFSKPSVTMTNVLAMSRYLDTIVTLKLYWS